MKQRHYSPYEYHTYLMENTVQTHAYNGGDVTEWQQQLQARVRELLGLGGEQRPDLNPISEWTHITDLGTIEKIVFASEPYADIPAYVCIPEKFSEPRTWMICVQGHSTGMHNSIGVRLDDETAAMDVPGDRDFAIGCMKNGVAALCIDQRAFGYREETVLERRSSNRCHDATVHALMLGKTLAGERVFDVDRAIDYLMTRKDVNPDRIGVMGNSGGGTTTLFAAAVLPRISFAMPSCYFCTFRDSIMSMHHCMDNYIPGLLRVAEMSDIMGLFAPKPLVIVAGRDDDIFPIEATERAFKELKVIYKAAGAAERCHLVIGEGGHRFYADDAWPVLLNELSLLVSAV